MKKILLCLLTGISILNLIGCSSDASVSGESSENGTDNAVKKSYGLNEDVYIINSYGEYRLKITGVTETSERNEYSDKKADRVIVISYEYENISHDSDLYISDYEFKAYDYDNNSLETYPIDVKYPASVGIGRKAAASMAFALNNNSNYVELEFYDNMWNSSSDCVFKLEW